MRKCLFIFFLTIFIFTIYSSLSPLFYIKKEEQEFDKLISIKNEPITNLNESIKEEENTLTKYQKLSSLNKDMIGWIKITNTNIDYPVMFKKNNEDYYLSHNFYKEKSYSGTPFVSKNYNKDNNNILIYGHNVNNKTLFSELLNYQKESFYQLHSTIQFDTLTEENTYQVISAFKSKVFYEDEQVFKYYSFDYNLNEQEFNYYINNIKALSLYETNTKVTYGDKIITLSTCNDEIEDGRFIVVAKLIK